MINIPALAGFTAMVTCAALPFSILAQSFPAKPIRLVVGFQPGGGVDTSARVIGKHLTESLGQPVIIDNKPGASGNIAAQLVAKAAADGYSLLMAQSNIAMPALFTNLPFDVNKNFAPVSLVAIGPTVLVAHPAVPINSVKDLIALARAKPKQLIYGTGGINNITHLQMELLATLAGIEMIHVPYKGSAPGIVALVSGEIYILFASIPSALPQIRAKRIKPIAVSTLRRSSALPNIPTLDEAGLKGYDAATWYGVFAPAGTANSVIGRLSGDIARIMHDPEIRNRFVRDGFEPSGGSAQEFSGFLRDELLKWAKVIKAAGLKPQ